MVKELRRAFVMPYWLYAEMQGTQPQTFGDKHVRDDRLYFVDKDGHVHTFEYLGRVCDQEPVPDEG